MLGRAIVPSLLLLTALWVARAEEAPLGVDDPRHGYYTTAPADRFSRFNDELKTGAKTLDTTDELSILRSLLEQLQTPVSSQMLVYSVTSLQKGLISPRRPRALYFNDDTYVGYVPGGRIEIISVDPQIGSVYYISDRLRPGQAPHLQRTQECMNCHAPHYLDKIPALLVESVVPGMSGGGERAFRREQSGHAVPLALRFGGWHVTGTGPNFPANQGNLVIDRHDGQAFEIPNPPGRQFDLHWFPHSASDVLPQLLQEHQVGFVNRATLAGYRARLLLEEPGRDEEGRAAGLRALASPLVEYLLFAEEAPLSPGSVKGEPEYRAAFLADRRPDAAGNALKDFDLQTRLFRFRCSYMIYTPSFLGLPSLLKQEIYRQLKVALGENHAEAFAYIPADEKKQIRSILSATLSDLPDEWKEDSVRTAASK